MELLREYQFEFEFPKKYPKKKYYPILLKAMFKKYLFYDFEYEYRLPLCDFDYKHCVFGRRYCTCRKEARIERREIRKGLCDAMTPMPDDAREQIALLAEQYHYDENGNFVRKDKDSPF